jgi:hypothetical protein
MRRDLLPLRHRLEICEREFLRRLDRAADPQQHPLVSSTIVMHEPNGICFARSGSAKEPCQLAGNSRPFSVIERA